MRTKTNWIVMLLIALGTIFILFPLYMTMTIALKSPEDMLVSVFGLPTELRFENFANAVRMTNFFNALGNSAAVTTATVILTLLTNSMVAYAIARNMDRKFLKACIFILLVRCSFRFRLLCCPWLSWRRD